MAKRLFNRPDEPRAIKAVLDNVKNLTREELEAYVNWRPEGFDDNSIETSENAHIRITKSHRSRLRSI